MVKVTHQPATVIENVTNFCYFCNALMLQGLWNEIFVEFGDKRLLSCTPVADIRLACLLYPSSNLLSSIPQEHNSRKRKAFQAGH